MVIEVALVIASLGFCVSLYFNMTNSRRSNREADQREATILASVTASLDHINNNVCEIKQDVKELRVEIKDVRERLKSVEISTKSAHRRIDELVYYKAGGTH